MAGNKHLSEDERVLHEMGYAQELSRRMGPFQSFAISFSIICIISGGLASFPIAMSTGGPWMATIGWVLGGLFALVVAASLGQIASAYPTAGSLYHWSSILGGRFWGWLTAYINLLGLMFVIPAVNVILYGFMKDLFFGGMLGWDVSGWTNFFDPNSNFTMGLVIIALITAAQCLLNQFGIKLTTMLTDFSGYLIFVITILLIILLATHVTSFNLGDAFTFSNMTGPAGGSVAPQHGIFLAILMGMLYPLFTITGFDASAHTSEETVDAQGTVHKGMMTSVFWSLVFGFLLALLMVLALPAVYTTLAAQPGQKVLSPEVMTQLGAISGGPKPMDMIGVLGWSSFTTLYNVLINNGFFGLICTLGIIIANFCCALSAITSTSRMVYAFARDGGLPRFLSSVNAQYRTPQAAIWFTGILTFLLVWITAPLNAFAALSTGCAMYLYVSYAMPVLAGLFAEGKTWTEFGKFRLGGLSKLFAWIVGIGTLGIIIGGHYFVPNGTTADGAFVPGLWLYSLGYLALLLLAWLGFENRRFKGPPMGDEIKRRQAEIAAKEAALSGGSSAMMSGSYGGTTTNGSGGVAAAATAVAAAGVATAASAASAASPIRSSVVSDDDARAARKRAEDARAAAEKAASERLAVARRAAEEAARVRATAAESEPAKAPAKSRATGVSKAAELGEGRSAKRKAPAKKAAKPRAPALDDIMLVDGIGPKLKKDLAAEGINSLSDLSKLSAAAIKALDAKIPRDADQIADWVAQAKDLLAGKAPRAAIDKARKAAKKS
jgi:amino acid transporter/predicted flap endonuclease-1-like 5' DNA nuclease